LEPTGRLLLGGQQSRILDLSHHDCNMKNDLARPDSRPEEGRAIWVGHLSSNVSWKEENLSEETHSDAAL